MQTVMRLLPRVSEAVFKVSLRCGKAFLPSPTGVWLGVTVEKGRYHSGKLPMSVHSSKVAMPVNCEAAAPSEVADESCKRHKQEFPELTDTFSLK